VGRVKEGGDLKQGRGACLLEKLLVSQVESTTTSVQVFDAIFLKLALLKTKFRSNQHGVGPHERDVLGDQF